MKPSINKASSANMLNATAYNENKTKSRKSVFFNTMAKVLNDSGFNPTDTPLVCDHYIDVAYDYNGIPTDYCDGKGSVPECLATLHLIHLDQDGNKTNVFSSRPTSAVGIESYARMVSAIMYQAIFWVDDLLFVKRSKVIDACRDIQRVLYAWRGYNNPTGNPVLEGENHDDYFGYTPTAFDYNEIKRNVFYVMPLNTENQEYLYEIVHKGYTVQLKRSLTHEKPNSDKDINAAIRLASPYLNSGTMVGVFAKKEWFINSRWTFLAKEEHDGFVSEEKYLISEKTPIDIRPMHINKVLETFEELYLK